MIPVLALDLGTKTGYAYRTASGAVTSGTWKLATAKEVREQEGRERDCRYCRLAENIHELVAREQIEILGFEDVQFSTYTAQTQLWASLRGAVWSVGCRYPGIDVEAVPVGSLKKFATGHGNATKEMMAAALGRTHPGYFLNVRAPDDNEIDALHLLHYLLKLKKA